MSSNVSVPKHIAIIMDGNGRWAEKRKHARFYGHIRGAKRVKPIVKEAAHLGVEALTLFAFSTENWSRPLPEIQLLWRLFRRYLLNELDELDRENVRFQVFGDIQRLEPDLQLQLKNAVERLKSNSGLKLNLAVSYGARWEIVQAAQRFAKDCQDGKLNSDQLNEKAFERYLQTSSLGELSSVDLLIRTSGEHRISNFLVWQSAYAELYFTDTYWPDFEPEDLRKAIHHYVSRERRFGAVRPSSPSTSWLQIDPGLIQINSQSQEIGSVG